MLILEIFKYGKWYEESFDLDLLAMAIFKSN
jgi:hypothetical protein